MVEEYGLQRVPRSWVTPRIWRWLCKGNIVTWEPFYTLCTRKATEAEKEAVNDACE